MALRIGIVAAALLVAGCGQEPQTQEPQQTKAAAPEKKKETAALGAEGKCPFTETTGWYAQIESSRFSVDGRVDLLMAGFKPALTKRSGAAGGEIALDLSLEPAPGGAVQAEAHYEEPLGTSYRRVAIYCGGKQVAAFEPLDQRG